MTVMREHLAALLTQTGILLLLVLVLPLARLRSFEPYRPVQFCLAVFNEPEQVLVGFETNRELALRSVALSVVWCRILYIAGSAIDARRVDGPQVVGVRSFLGLFRLLCFSIHHALYRRCANATVHGGISISVRLNDCTAAAEIRND